MAKVAVDDKHTFILDGEADGKIDGDERLAAAGIERGEDIDVLGAIGRRHEIDVGTQHAECLVGHVATALADDDELLVAMLLVFIPSSASDD